MYSKNPAPLDKGFLGEFKIGRMLIKFSNPFKFIEKIVSRIT